MYMANLVAVVALYTMLGWIERYIPSVASNEAKFIATCITMLIMYDVCRFKKFTYISYAYITLVGALHMLYIFRH